MKEVKKILLRGILLLLIITASTRLFAQIGGNDSPLQYSIHTYSIVMSDITDIVSWGIYPTTVTAAQIEDGSAAALALVPGTHYTIVGVPWKDATRSYFRVQFSVIAGPTAQADYYIGYMETTSDANSCKTAELLQIHVYPPFDVDVALLEDPADCPDDTDDLREAGETVYQTEVQYSVFVNHPASYVSGAGTGQWRFDFRIAVDGFATGTNATIASITATGAGFTTQSWTPPLNTSDYTNSCIVNPSSITPLTFTVVYNDVLGVTQDIAFSLSAISGAFDEPDIDIVNPPGTGNVVTNTIYSMPNAGYIMAWN